MYENNINIKLPQECFKLKRVKIIWTFSERIDEAIAIYQ